MDVSQQTRAAVERWAALLAPSPARAARGQAASTAATEGALASALGVEAGIAATGGDEAVAAKLRKAAETFSLPDIFKRRRTEPAAPLPPGSFTPAGPEAPPLLVPGWPNDPTYKTYINSKGLPPGAAAAALASYGRSGRLGTSRPGGKGKGSLGLAPLGGMGSPGRAPLTSPTQSHRRVDGAVTAAAAAIGMDTAVAGLLESSRQCVQKVSCRKGPSGSRTYTSKYRGVHQTFPTRRWEAQFRRAGKPTSLGCFNLEEEAARAYDKMMLWCEIHHADLRSLGLLRNGVTNFPAAAYAVDMPALREMTQDELVAELRRMGRLQAASGAPRGAGKAAQEGKADQDGRAASA